jgi:hypothetical protein
MPGPEHRTPFLEVPLLTVVVEVVDRMELAAQAAEHQASSLVVLLTQRSTPAQELAAVAPALTQVRAAQG